MSSRSGFQWLPLTVFVAVVGALVWYGTGPGAWFEPDATGLAEGAPVRRGPLRISVVERGNLDAADSASLKSEIEGQVTILYLIDEGVNVAEGDLVCELDSTELLEKRFQRELSVRNAEAAYIKSQQSFEIQESQNISDVALAEQNLEFAREDLRKFREGDRGSRLAQAQESIELAKEEFKRAQDKLDWSERLASKGFLTATELEADRLANNRAKILLEQAKRNSDLLVEFELPREEAELVAAVQEAERELDRVRLQAKARIVDFETAMRTNKDKLDLESDKLAKLEDQIGKTKLYAPRDGMVVYAKLPGGRMGRGEPMEEGAQVRERQEIITIPSERGMVAQASLHESVLKQVRTGQECVVKVDSLPELSFRGRVEFVAPLPDQQSWWANPNLRVYRTDIAVLDRHPEMRPGMSCSIEILVEDIEDAIHVPVQSVFRHEGGNVAFVVGSDGEAEQRSVEVGSYNDRWVQVRSGLSEGEIVLLSPPPGVTLRPDGDSEQKGPPPVIAETGSGADGRGEKGRGSPAGRESDAGAGSKDGQRGPGSGRRSGGGAPDGAAAVESDSAATRSGAPERRGDAQADSDGRGGR